MHRTGEFKVGRPADIPQAPQKPKITKRVNNTKMEVAATHKVTEQQKELRSKNATKHDLKSILFQDDYPTKFMQAKQIYRNKLRSP